MALDGAGQSLLGDSGDAPKAGPFEDLVAKLDLAPCFQRSKIYDQARLNQETIHNWLMSPDDQHPEKIELWEGLLGIKLAPGGLASIPLSKTYAGRPAVDIHSARIARRSGPDGQETRELIVEITQRRYAFDDPKKQARADRNAAYAKKNRDFIFRGERRSSSILPTIRCAMRSASGSTTNIGSIDSAAGVAGRKLPVWPPPISRHRRWRSPSPSRIGSSAAMAKPPIRVRMYKKLLGDCFLLTIGDPGASRDDRVHILIDCGILQRVPGEVAIMQAVADDIVATTGGQLHLLVITHEHWDHISGFVHARQALIDDMQIDALWLAWTERRGDGQADTLRKKSEKAKKVVAQAAAFAAKEKVNVTANIQHFNGPLAANGKLTSLARHSRADQAGRGDGRGRLSGTGRRPHHARSARPARACAGTVAQARLPHQDAASGGRQADHLTAEFALALDERYAAAGLRSCRCWNRKDRRRS